jgi:hypothetical protein
MNGFAHRHCRQASSPRGSHPGARLTGAEPGGGERMTLEAASDSHCTSAPPPRNPPAIWAAADTRCLTANAASATRETYLWTQAALSEAPAPATRCGGGAPASPRALADAAAAARPRAPAAGPPAPAMAPPAAGAAGAAPPAPRRAATPPRGAPPAGPDFGDDPRRLERLRAEVYGSARAASAAVAREIADLIRARAAEGRKVWGCARRSGGGSGMPAGARPACACVPTADSEPQPPLAFPSQKRPCWGWPRGPRR